MAHYDYRCTSCKSVFEVEHGMTEHPSITCPTCGAPAEKVFSASGIKFEGSGFYNTDQRGGGKDTAATAGPSSSSEGSGSHDCGCKDCPHKAE